MSRSILRYSSRRFAIFAGLVTLAALTLLLAACGKDEPPDSTTPAPSGSPSAVIAVERAVVFPRPDRSAPPLTYLFEREQVTVRGQSVDGVFWLVAVGAGEGWILAAQADRIDDAPLPVIELIAPDATSTPPATLTRTPAPTPTQAKSATPRMAATPRTTPPTLTITPFPPPTSAALDVPEGIGATSTPRSIWPGTPPPLTLELPAGWQAAHVLLPFQTPASLREVPMSLYEGALPGGATGHLFLFWGFPNVTSPTGEISLWTDALQLLRGSLVDQSCNLGIDLAPKTYRVGGHEAAGTLFSAVDCAGEPDTAGYFAALQVEGGNYAFFFAVEPPGAFADQLPTLQAILDSVRFEAAGGAP